MNIVKNKIFKENLRFTFEKNVKKYTNCMFLDMNCRVLSFWFENCIFENCKFESCFFLVDDSTFKDCQFNNLRQIIAHRCAFEGKNEFINCDFYTSKLLGLCTFLDSETKFYNCEMEGLVYYQHEGQTEEARKTNEVIEKFFPLRCPQNGTFLGYKKIVYIDNCLDKWFCLCTIRIPEEALRMSSTGTKCRCSEAIVVDIQRIDRIGNLIENQHLMSGFSIFDPNFVYEVGKTVKVDNFDKNRFHECSRGIHFFMSKQEAIEYVM